MVTVALKRFLVLLLIGLLVGLPIGPPVQAQAPTAGEAPPPRPLSPEELETLVGRIALYPDDLVAIILPASTFPLDVVQADRFLQKLKQDKNLKPDERWDESIRNLLNYPDVISMMSQDLEWTQDLGEAMVGQQTDVLKAIQAFRAKAQEVGNLKTDDKQIIVQENNTIQIVPADPEVIYVPQYQPSTVVAVTSPPVYYPTPYPSYYYPYPPGYAFAGFATGVFFGAALAYGANWGGGHIENNININNTSNFNTNRVNAQNQQKVNQARQQGQQRAQQQPAGQRGGQGGRGQAGASQWQSQKRPGEVSQGRVSPRTSEARPGYGGSGASRGDAFGSGGRGSDAMRDSSRGAQSRGSASTMDRGGSQLGGGSRGGASASTMDRGGSRGGSSSMGSGSRGGSGSMGSGSRGGSGSMGSGSRGGGGGGGGRGGGGGGRRR